MTVLPTDQWTAALDQMSAAIIGQIADLDSRQHVEPVDEPPSAPAGRPEELLAWMDDRFARWDQRLDEAARQAAAAEQHLGEREAELTRWQKHLVRWQELIEQSTVPPDTSTGSNSSE